MHGYIMEANGGNLLIIKFILLGFSNFSIG